MLGTPANGKPQARWQQSSCRSHARMWSRVRCQPTPVHSQRPPLVKLTAFVDTKSYSVRIALTKKFTFNERINFVWQCISESRMTPELTERYLHVSLGWASSHYCPALRHGYLNLHNCKIGVDSKWSKGIRFSRVQRGDIMPPVVREKEHISREQPMPSWFKNDQMTHMTTVSTPGKNKVDDLNACALVHRGYFTLSGLLKSTDERLFCP